MVGRNPDDGGDDWGSLVLNEWSFPESGDGDDTGFSSSVSARARSSHLPLTASRLFVTL